MKFMARLSIYVENNMDGCMNLEIMAYLFQPCSSKNGK